MTQKMKRNEGWYKVFMKGAYNKYGVTVYPDASFDDLRDDLASIETEYGDTHSKFKIYVDIESDYGGGDTTYYYVYGWRKETDEEYDARCAYRLKWDAEAADHERIEYERLAKKFGSK